MATKRELTPGLSQVLRNTVLICGLQQGFEQTAVDRLLALPEAKIRKILASPHLNKNTVDSAIRGAEIEEKNGQVDAKETAVPMPPAKTRSLGVLLQEAQTTQGARAVPRPPADPPPASLRVAQVATVVPPTNSPAPPATAATVVPPTNSPAPPATADEVRSAPVKRSAREMMSGGAIAGRKARKAPQPKWHSVGPEPPQPPSPLKLSEERQRPHQEADDGGEDVSAEIQCQNRLLRSWHTPEDLDRIEQFVDYHGLSLEVALALRLVEEPIKLRKFFAMEEVQGKRLAAMTEPARSFHTLDIISKIDPTADKLRRRFATEGPTDECSEAPSERPSCDAALASNGSAPADSPAGAPTRAASTKSSSSRLQPVGGQSSKKHRAAASPTPPWSKRVKVDKEQAAHHRPWDTALSKEAPHRQLPPRGSVAKEQSAAPSSDDHISRGGIRKEGQRLKPRHRSRSQHRMGRRLLASAASAAARSAGRASRAGATTRGQETDGKNALKDCLLSLDNSGDMLQYLVPLRREFASLPQITAALIDQPKSGTSVLGCIEPKFWEDLHVHSLGHKLLLAKGIIALAAKMEAG